VFRAIADHPSMMVPLLRYVDAFPF